MNKYRKVEIQEEKVIKLENEKNKISKDICKTKDIKELDEIEKRITSLRRKRNYLYKQIEKDMTVFMNHDKQYGLLNRLDDLLTRREFALDKENVQ